jgi:uncharacterized protein
MMNDPLPPTLDIHEFSREAHPLSGQSPVSSLPRLAESLEPGCPPLRWSFAGQSILRADGSREARAELSLSGHLTMRCTRCLLPMACLIDERRRYRFVSSEAQAETEDAEDEDFDVLVASRQFDLRALLEDEALMALPLAPRHAHCEMPAQTEGQATESASPSPSTVAAAPAAGANPWTQALSSLRSQVRGEQDDAKD